MSPDRNRPGRRPLTELEFSRAIEEDLVSAADRRETRALHRLPSASRMLAYAAVVLLIVAIPLALSRVLTIPPEIGIDPLDEGPQPIDSDVDDAPREDVEFFMDIVTPDAEDGVCEYTTVLRAESGLPGEYRVELIVSHGGREPEEDVLKETWDIGPDESTWSATAQTVAHPQDAHSHFFELIVYQDATVVFEELLVTDACPGG